MKLKHLALFLLTLAVSQQVSATTLVRVSFNEQAVKADAVVLGVVSRVEDTDVGGFPFRRAVLLVEETIAGGNLAGEIAVLQPGGRRIPRRGTVRVAGVRYMNPGEEYLLMLQRRGDGQFDIVGMVQGQYRVRKEPGAARKLITVPERNGAERTMTIEAARSRIHAARANAKARGAQ